MNGNSLLTINGSGFSVNNLLTTVTINSNPCEIIDTNNTSITCTLPPSDTAGDFDLIVNVINTQVIPNVTETATTTFT